MSVQHYYTVYTVNVSYKPEYRVTPKVGLGGETPVYIRTVKAASRAEALEKCMGDIRAELPKIQGKYLSIFVGKKFYPSEYPGRLTPIQIVVETGELRRRS